MRSLLALILGFAFSFSAGVSAAPLNSSSLPVGDTSGREFLMSCTYGVLAGSLVGAASLAFASQPGKSLNRVARGASIGLYAGILLGLYAVYIVPGMENPEPDPIVFFLPTIHEDSKGSVVDGLQAQWTALRF